MYLRRRKAAILTIQKWYRAWKTRTADQIISNQLNPVLCKLTAKREQHLREATFVIAWHVKRFLSRKVVK